MTTVIATHEVMDGKRWAQAWHPGPGSKHELMAKLGVKARAFQDPENPNIKGLIFEVPDMKAFQEFMQSDEARKAMGEDGVKPETLRMLVEFTP